MRTYITPDAEKHVNREKFHEYLKASNNKSWDRVLLFSVNLEDNKNPLHWPGRWTPMVAVYAAAHASGDAAYLVELLGVEDNGNIYCWDEVARFSRVTDEESFGARHWNPELANNLLPETLGSFLFMMVVGNKRKEYLEGDESKIHGTPQIGDQFYVDGALYISHPGSRNGGLVTITAIRRVYDSYYVKTEEFVGMELGIGRRGPNSWGGPGWSERQETLKRRFGDQRAKSVAFNDYEVYTQQLEERELEKLFSNEPEEPN